MSALLLALTMPDGSQGLSRSKTSFAHGSGGFIMPRYRVVFAPSRVRCPLRQIGGLSKKCRPTY